MLLALSQFVESISNLITNSIHVSVQQNAVPNRHVPKEASLVRIAGAGVRVPYTTRQLLVTLSLTVQRMDM